MDATPASSPNLTRTEWLRDAALAVALTVAAWLQVATFQLFASSRPPRPPMPKPAAAPFSIEFVEPTAWTYLLIAATFLPLVFRRRFPLTVLAVVTAIAAFYDRLPHTPSLTVVAPLVALYTVGTLRDRRTLWTATAIAFAFTAGVMYPQLRTDRLIGELARVAATFAVAASVGDATRNRRAYVAEVEERAAEAERTREEEARRRVEEERLRIARELHDITAHSLSIIAVQAGAAEKIVERDPAAARKALDAIRLTSKESLEELRSMLGVLRGADDVAPLAPTGRLARLQELIGSVEKAGIEVSLKVDGDVQDVPLYADVSAYRIVQEALTNVVRHAHATRASVRLTRKGDVLEVEIVDDGRGVATGAQTPEGHGIAGMRERAAALGGSLEAGPLQAGGYRVAARLPLDRGV